MGWSQVEPIRNLQNTDYNHFYYGDQAAKRIEKYDKIMNAVKQIYQKVNNKEAFYQLVYYPVICSGLMNKRILFLEKAYL
jgi:hypothetical protein